MRRVFPGRDAFFGLDLPNLPPFTWIEQDRVTVVPSEKLVIDPSEGVVLPRNFVGCAAAPNWKLADILPEITRRAVAKVHELAKKEKPFFLLFSQASPHEPVVPSARFKGKSGIAPIVIFTADDGHSHYTRWKDLVDAGHAPSGPFRGHKGNIREGGHRVPFVVRRPKKIAAGSESSYLVSLTDLFATFAELLGEDLPKDAAEDSHSFLAAALGTSSEVRKTPIVSHSLWGEFAFRQGDWKLVFRNRAHHPNRCRGEKRMVELYQLGEDVSETNDVAKRNPEVVRRLTRELRNLVDRGAPRTGLRAKNDADVRFDATRTRRWVEARGTSE